MRLSHEVEHGERAVSFWLYLAWPWGLVVVAWALMLLSVPTGLNVWIDHDYLLVTSRLPWLVALLLFLAAWQVMLWAMMLPTTFSMQALVMARGRARVGARQALFLGAYALVWTIFALIAFVGDTVLHWLVAHWWWLYTHSWCIGAAMFVLAAAVQFSPLKRACLRQCRNPAATCSGKEIHTLRGSWRLGLRYGRACLGSCWAIMLVMFAVGMKQIVVVAILAGMMFAEKELPGRRFVSPAMALAFCVSAVVWAVLPQL